MPCSICQELSGEMHAPRFLSGTVLMRRMNASGASGSGRSCPQRSPWYDVSGLSNAGCLPPAQLNFPESITIPPIEVPWPPSHLVSEWTTMSAPCSMGRQRYGVEKVESTMSGSPWV